MKEEKMCVPSGLKTVDGKDIMCYKYAIIESAIDKKRLKEQSYRIPMVIPIVLYTGKKNGKDY